MINFICRKGGDRVKEEYMEKIKDIVRWMAWNHFTVSESKAFFATAQACIENSAPVNGAIENSMFENYISSSDFTD